MLVAPLLVIAKALLRSYELISFSESNSAPRVVSLIKPLPSAASIMSEAILIKAARSELGSTMR